MFQSRNSALLRLAGILVAAGISLVSAACAPSPTTNVDILKKDEVVLFFPTYASFDAKQHTWEVPIHGWAYEPERNDINRKLLVHALTEALDLDEDDAEEDIFARRARLFLVDNERGKRFSIRLGDEVHQLDESDANGHFRSILRLPRDRVEALLQQPQAARSELHFNLLVGAHESRIFFGRIHLIQPQGLSVISDIDDTIKITQVTDTKELLRNTFAREFEAIPGMAKVYQRWAEQGATFHYISASPWQLYEPLEAFIEQSGFPAGTFHLKTFRVNTSSILKLFDSPEETKTEPVETLLKKFPERRFILVGDASERDPEIYGTIARKYPLQIERIYIHCYDKAFDKNSQRFQEAFRDISQDRWRIFTQADELPVD